MARDSEGGLVSIAYLSAGLALSPIETNSLRELSSFKPSFIRTLTSTSTPPPPFSNRRLRVLTSFVLNVESIIYQTNRLPAKPAIMAERYIPEHRRTQFKAKNTFKPEELRRRREEQQVEIRKAKREENLAKRRGIAGGDGARLGASLGAEADSDDDNVPSESQVG